MDANVFEGNWKQLKGSVKQRWGQLTDDDLMTVEGERDKLVGAIQTRYGKAKDAIEREVDAFINEHGKNAGRARRGG